MQSRTCPENAYGTEQNTLCILAHAVFVVFVVDAVDVLVIVVGWRLHLHFSVSPWLPWSFFVSWLPCLF